MTQCFEEEGREGRGEEGGKERESYSERRMDYGGRGGRERSLKLISMRLVSNWF